LYVLLQLTNGIGQTSEFTKDVHVG